MADRETELLAEAGHPISPIKAPEIDSSDRESALLAEAGQSLPKLSLNTSAGTDFVHDVGIGALQVPGALVGLADIPAGLMGYDQPFSKGAEKLGELTGFQPGKLAEEAQKKVYSPARQAAEKRVTEAWDEYEQGKGGILGAIGKTMAEPRVLAGTVAQSAPSMATGMGLSRLAKLAAPAIPGVVAGAAGEGAVSAGQQMDQSAEGIDPQRRAIAAGLTGLGVGAVGYGAGKVANKLGLTDIETAAAGGKLASDVTPLPAYKRIPGGMVSEGLLEEAPQSAIEQASQNIAEGKDVTSGMARSVVQGALAGGVMGAGANILPTSAETAKADEDQLDLRTDAEKAADTAKPIDLTKPPAATTPPIVPVTEPATTPEPSETPAANIDEKLKNYVDTYDKKLKDFPAWIPTKQNGLVKAATAAGVYDENDDPATTYGKLRDIVYPPTEPEIASRKAKAVKAQQLTELNNAPDGTLVTVAKQLVTDGQTPGTKIEDHLLEVTVEESADVDTETPVDLTDVDTATGEITPPPADYSNVSDAMLRDWLAKSTNLPEANAAIKAELAKRSPQQETTPLTQTTETPDGKSENQTAQTTAQKITDGIHPFHPVLDAAKAETAELANELAANNIPPETVAAIVERQERRAVAQRELDPTIGFEASKYFKPAMERVIKHVSETGEPAFFIDGDLANLGGLNAHFGNNTDKANVVYKGITDIFRAELGKAGTSAMFLKHGGGDEFGSVVFGTNAEELSSALARASARIKSFIAEQGLSDITHPKYKSGVNEFGASMKGTGIHAGFAQIAPGMSLAEVRDAASLDLDNSKKGIGHVRRESDETVGSGSPTTGGTAESTGGKETPTGSEDTGAAVQVGQGTSEKGITPVDEAAAQTEANKTDVSSEQEQNGDYQKAALVLSGIPISIENSGVSKYMPEGSVREGVGADGKPWRVQLKDHYGEIHGTNGADGENVDVFIKPGTQKINEVFIIDQWKVGADGEPTGEFDEHKIVFGAKTAKEAADIYSRNYSPGWKGLGPITAIKLKDFKEDWLTSDEKMRNPSSKTTAVIDKAAKQKADKEAKKPKVDTGPFHPAIAQLASDLSEAKDNMGYVKDANDRIIGRLPSTNPEWFKDGNFTAVGARGGAVTPSVKAIKTAVTAYENNEPLTFTQGAILRSLSDLAESQEAEANEEFEREKEAEAEYEKRNGESFSLFDESPAELNDLARKQQLADFTSKKDKARNGGGQQAEPPALLSDNEFLAGQTDITDLPEVAPPTNAEINKAKKALSSTKSKLPGFEDKSKAEAIELAVKAEKAFTVVEVTDKAAQTKDYNLQKKIENATATLASSTYLPPRVQNEFEELYKKVESGEYAAIQQRLLHGKYLKPEYRVYQGRKTDGGYNVISKGEYEYAKLLEKQEAEPEVIELEDFVPEDDYDDAIPFSRREDESLLGLFKSLGKFDKAPADINHSEAERIRYVQDNFLDLLSDLETSGKVDIKC